MLESARERRGAVRPDRPDLRPAVGLGDRGRRLLRRPGARRGRARGRARRRHRQDRRADRGADHAQRKLVQPVRIVEIAERSGADAGEEERVDEGADLVDARAQGGGYDDPDELADPGRHPRTPQPQDDAGSLAGQKQQAELEDSAHRHGDRQGGRRDRAPLGHEDQRGQHGEVQQGGGEGRGREPRNAVEDAGEQGNEADQEQVREGDPRQVGREVELGAGIAGDRRDEERHDDLEEQGEDDQSRDEDRQNFLGKALRLDLAILALQALGVERDESGGKGALAEQPSEGVRKAEGNEESVRLPARTHDAGHQHLAREAGDTADQGQAADRPRGLEQVHGRRDCRRPSGGVLVAFRRVRGFRRSVAAAVAGAGLSLLRLQLRHVGRAEIDSVEQEGRKARVLRRFGDDLAREREQQARALDHHHRVEALLWHIADTEYSCEFQFESKQECRRRLCLAVQFDDNLDVRF